MRRRSQKPALSPARVMRTMRLGRKEVLFIVALIVLYGLFEGFGISLLLPVLQYIESGPSALAHSSGVWKGVVTVYRALGLPVSLPGLLTAAFIPVLLRQVVYFANSWYVARLQRGASQRLRIDGFSALAYGDLSFVVAEGQGPLVSILTQQIYRGSTAILQFIQLIGAGVLITVYFAILLAISPPLAVVTIVATAGISSMVGGSVKRSRQYGRQVSEAGNATFAMIAERVGALRLIKMRGQEQREIEGVREISARFETAQLRIAISRAVVEVTVDPALMLAVFVIVWAGVEGLGLSLASLGIFLFILLRLNQQAKVFNVSRQALSGTLDGLEMVLDTIGRAQAAETVLGGNRQFEGLEKSISFRNVSFSYDDSDGDRNIVLDGVDIEIPRGSMTAFVGRSGAGKSTLVDLIPHLRDVTGGQILFDGVDVGEFDLYSLRRRIGFMTQEAILFNDTIRGNLLYGLEREPSAEEVQAALSSAYCNFVDELPEGLETGIGDRGVRLSGGQRQRLALARVLLENPNILILDEPTSALDSESELYIQKALDKARETRTVIVIAHRLSTVQSADLIYVLEQGKVVESGTHGELLGRDGPYHRLFQLQTNL